MAGIITPDANAPKPQTPAAEIEKLRATITDMGGLACEGLSAIEAVANIAQRYLETPAAYRGGGTLHTILGIIRERADTYYDLIGQEAKEAGCHTDNEPHMRCYAAMDTVRQKDAA